jgi:hypothetical protein
LRTSQPQRHALAAPFRDSASVFIRDLYGFESIFPGAPLKPLAGWLRGWIENGLITGAGAPSRRINKRTGAGQ